MSVSGAKVGEDGGELGTLGRLGSMVPGPGVG